MWALDAAVVAACAALLALSASSLVKSRFRGLTMASPPGFRPRSSPYKPAHDKRPDAILRRNIFCSTCPPLLGGEPDAGTDDVPPELQATTLPLKLVAVMYAPSPKEQKWDTAVIRDDDSKTIGAFAVGAQVDGATLIDILDTRVYLNNAGTTEYLDLLSPPKAAPHASPRPASAPRPKGDTFSLSSTVESRKSASIVTSCKEAPSNRYWETSPCYPDRLESSPIFVVASLTAFGCSRSDPTAPSRRLAYRTATPSSPSTGSK